MSKTWQLLKKEHRRLRFWWWVWWLLVLSDAVLRYTQAAYVGDHGLEASMRLYERAFPYLAMGLSVLIIGLSHLEEAPVAKASFGQGLPLSPLRLFLVKTGLLLAHLIVLPALIEWIVCLGEGFGAYSPGLVLDWVVDRVLILCACIAIAAMSGNMGVYVVLLVLAKGATLLAPWFRDDASPVIFSRPLVCHATVLGAISILLFVAYHQYRTRRQLRSLLALLLTLIVLGNWPHRLMLWLPGQPSVASTWSIDPTAEPQRVDGVVLRPDPAVEIHPSPWQYSGHKVARWLLSEGLLPVMKTSPANLMSLDSWRRTSRSKYPLAQPELIAELPLEVGATIKDRWRLRRIEEVASGRLIEVTLLERRPLAYRMARQGLLPPEPSGKFSYVLLNRRLGLGAELEHSPDGNRGPRWSEKVGHAIDWRGRRLDSEKSILKVPREQKVGHLIWHVPDVTLAIVRWRPSDEGPKRLMLAGLDRIWTKSRGVISEWESIAGDIHLGPGELPPAWPDKNDRDAVSTYLDAVIRYTGRGSAFGPMREVHIRAFVGVGRENLDLLIGAGLALPWDNDRKREVLAAIGRLATDEDRELVCSVLCAHFDVLPVILERGWQEYAREIILEAAVANPYRMSSQWVELLLGVDDPRAEDSIWKRVVLGEWSPLLYDMVVAAGVDLSARIGQQWQLALIFGDDRGLLVGLRTGHPGAVGRIAGLREGDYLWSKVKHKVLEMMRKRSPFDGEDEDFLPWFKERWTLLTFDEDKQAYVFKGGIQ